MPIRLDSRSWESTSSQRSRLPRLAAFIAVASGCAPTALSSARQKMAAGQYAAARQELLAIPLGNLNDSQRREVKDDLCVSDVHARRTDLLIGEQRRVCVDAAEEPGSQSAQFVAKIDEQVRRSSYEKVNAALANGDLGGAEQAAQVYVNTPGADPAVVAKWSHADVGAGESARPSQRTASQEGSRRRDRRDAQAVSVDAQDDQARVRACGSRNRAASREPRCSPRSR